MKDVESRVMAELFKNSRRSDRELAKQLRVSQPTVTRVRTRLEKEGIIREYTIIPDFSKLGFKLVSIVFGRLKEPVSQKTISDLRGHAAEMRALEQGNPSPTIVSMKGIGCEADYVSVAFHKTYSEYTQFIAYVRQFPHVKVDQIKSFLIDLQDRSHMRYLTLSVFADYLLRTKEDS